MENFPDISLYNIFIYKLNQLGLFQRMIQQV